MPDNIPPELRVHIQSLAAAGRHEIERYQGRVVLRMTARRVAFLRGVGAVAIGIFASGFAILVTVIILNIMFHYSPT